MRLTCPISTVPDCFSRKCRFILLSSLLETGDLKLLFELLLFYLDSIVVLLRKKVITRESGPNLSHDFFKSHFTKEKLKVFFFLIIITIL